jgi:hypothetical protein
VSRKSSQFTPTLTVVSYLALALTLYEIDLEILATRTIDQIE